VQVSVGKTIKLFLADGKPGGLITAEILNWTGHVVMAPRSSLAELVKRPEMSRTGIYILIGDDPDSFGGTTSYVGEADDISRRLYQHSRSEALGGKDFWDRAIAVTSKDFNLTKAHARWLESKLITLAAEARRTRLINGTNPPLIQLPEADVSDMEYFTEQIKLVLPVLGENLFRSSRIESRPVTPSEDLVSSVASPVFELYQRNDDIRATAQEIDGEFTVFAGSLARGKWIGTGAGYRQLFDQLVQNATLIPEEQNSRYLFARDQVFSAPSAAAAVVLGRPANGRTEWKVKHTGETYGGWQDRRVTQSTQDV
jgi:hypothetical protein